MSDDRPALMPADTPDFMAPAWLSCMHWAIGKPEVRAEFEAETGARWTSPRTGLDRMIDEATGGGTAYVERFIAWANINVWGSMEGEDGDG